MSRAAALTAMLPLPHDAVVAARSAASALERGAASPFATVPGIHTGRLTVVDEAGGAFVLLCVDADIKPAAIATVIAANVPLRTVFEHCENAPPDERGLAAWLLGHRLRKGIALHGYAGASAADVIGALLVRERIGALASTAEQLAPAALRVRLRAVRGELA